ncbi:MAG: hypothetical protein CM1200mP28_00110 [Deltaproteobacteria bacterium]|nr:MAG: hypothetical protein CM1200mP28_00110 [Deltaproteobacteria bacterium]
MLTPEYKFLLNYSSKVIFHCQIQIETSPQMSFPSKFKIQLHYYYEIRFEGKFKFTRNKNSGIKFPLRKCVVNF